MSAIAAMRLPEQVDLSGFIALLQRLQVPHRVAEEAGEQVLWVPEESLAEHVRALYARYPHGDAAVAVQGRVLRVRRARHGAPVIAGDEGDQGHVIPGQPEQVAVQDQVH